MQCNQKSRNKQAEWNLRARDKIPILNTFITAQRNSVY